jgi:hypothetical protein
MKLIQMHVGGIGAKIWFGVLVWKGKNISSIHVHDNLTFMKHIYVDVNADVIIVMPRFMEQDWVGWVAAAGVGQSGDE